MGRWVGVIVPPYLGAPEMSRRELPQDPGTWGQLLRVWCCEELEGEGVPSTRFPEVAKSPIIRRIRNFSLSSRLTPSPL